MSISDVSKGDHVSFGKDISIGTNVKVWNLVYILAINVKLEIMSL